MELLPISSTLIGFFSELGDSPFEEPPTFRWEFQDPKMEVLYHVGTSNLGSWNSH